MSGGKLMATIKQEKRLADLEEEIKKIQEKRRALQRKIKAATRKAKNKNLVKLGLMMEKLLTIDIASEKNRELLVEALNTKVVIQDSETKEDIITTNLELIKETMESLSRKEKVEEVINDLKRKKTERSTKAKAKTKSEK